ncbi:alpha/beta fold hydrolase [Hydrogenophaga sp. RWCD_12]|uniref:alpha/beta fold hydrolase n=1 Tax=Hydrogenophaga sp. RWCD_12 TaxID=3391190 RepID=UPI003985041A
MNLFHADDGARLAYADDGEGLPLLALGGLTRDSRDFDYLERRLPAGVRLIRLDSRGRGQSAWSGPATYTVPREANDVVNLLDHLALDRVAILGTSRGGLLGMVLAATQKHRLLGLCLNDVGPVLERAGLQRIATYVGITPTVATLEEIADRMPQAMPGFRHVPPMRWVEETVRHYEQLDGRVGLTYDPDLRIALAAAMSAPPADAWPLFDACAGLPLALLRGANSDVLSRETAQAMRERRPDMSFAEVPDRGHAPFLDEQDATDCIHRWLDRVAEFAVAPPHLPVSMPS